MDDLKKELVTQVDHCCNVVKTTANTAWKLLPCPEGRGYNLNLQVGDHEKPIKNNKGFSPFSFRRST